jgi:anthranilate synthase/aminodeoxychorismate synthase-like glutamine amidotransferase
VFTAMRLLMLDNFDSFTFNLVHYFRELGAEVNVVRNNEIDGAGVIGRGPDAICLSPGPGRPEAAGNMPGVIAACVGKVPMLGICLGHQAIAQHFGGQVVHAPKPMHGKTCEITHDGVGLFQGIGSPLTVCRYHSLVADGAAMPECLRVTARAGDGSVMAVEHRQLPVWGLQFHPEAVLTQAGHELLGNFLALARAARAA